MLAMTSRSVAAVIIGRRLSDACTRGERNDGSLALGDDLAVELGERGKDAKDTHATAPLNKTPPENT
ncbi:MAG: hypothetical protein WAU78_08285 [Roseiarcus sp.]|jgi:hypothetical protein